MYRFPIKRMRGQVALALGILLATSNSAAAQPALLPHDVVKATVGFATVEAPPFRLPKAMPLPLPPPPPPPVCQYGPGGELGLMADALRGEQALCVMFPQVTAFGGFRAGDQDHGTGTAVDCMISDTVAGDALAEFILAHAAEFNVKYVIYKQRIRYPGSDWTAMEDRGSPTQNHMDHVHVSFNG